MMDADQSKVTIHMVSSLDGFIAKKDGSVEWMHSKDNYEAGELLTAEAISTFLESIDCYLMGSHTYEKALELGWPYGEVPVFVMSNRKFSTDKTSVTFYNGDLRSFVNEQLKPKFKNIWMVGGAELTKQFLRLDLADEIVISFMPTILGEGTLFFDFIGIERTLHLKDIKAYKDGMAELTYEINKGKPN